MCVPPNQDHIKVKADEVTSLGSPPEQNACCCSPSTASPAERAGNFQQGFNETPEELKKSLLTFDSLSSRRARSSKDPEPQPAGGGVGRRRAGSRDFQPLDIIDPPRAEPVGPSAYSGGRRTEARFNGADEKLVNWSRFHFHTSTFIEGKKFPGINQ